MRGTREEAQLTPLFFPTGGNRILRHGSSEPFLAPISSLFNLRLKVSEQFSSDSNLRWCHKIVFMRAFLIGMPGGMHRKGPQLPSNLRPIRQTRFFEQPAISLPFNHIILQRPLNGHTCPRLSNGPTHNGRHYIPCANEDGI
jgi:hypothetical protein